MLIGKKDETGKISGDNVIYLYPGFTLGLIGNFQNNKVRISRKIILTQFNILVNKGLFIDYVIIVGVPSDDPLPTCHHM